MKQHKYTLGIKPDGSPRYSLSYSGAMMWLSSKDSYRRRYYENERPFETAETIFGKQIGDRLENNDPELAWVPRYNTPELTIEIEVEGAYFNGRLDTIEDETKAFLDYKSGHANKDGKPPWDNVKVRKHKQLPWYSWLVKKKYGIVKNLCHIIWLETEFIQKTIEFAGHILTTQTRELRLTGKIKKFSRIIREWERKNIEVEALRITKEIHADYEEYKRIRAGETFSQEVSQTEKVL